MKLIVWSNIVKIIVSEDICNNNAPSGCAGYSKCNIGSAKTIIPIVQGSPISILAIKENETLFVVVSLSPLAIALEIVGTNAVAKAILIDKGNDVNVSTFPPKIPYCAFASDSVINFLSPLTTVNESIFLLKDDIIELNDIGIETLNIFFTILLTF